MNSGSLLFSAIVVPFFAVAERAATKIVVSK
jgi:hypothetical protein